MTPFSFLLKNRPVGLGAACCALSGGEGGLLRQEVRLLTSGTLTAAGFFGKSR
jgi:hypothetical protein